MYRITNCIPQKLETFLQIFLVFTFSFDTDWKYQCLVLEIQFVQYVNISDVMVRMKCSKINYCAAVVEDLYVE